MSAGNQVCIGNQRMLQLAEVDACKEQIPQAEARALPERARASE